MEVADRDADARPELLLQLDGGLVVELAITPATTGGRIVGDDWQRTAEAPIVERTALAVGRRIGQVALRDEVQIRVRPATACRRDNGESWVNVPSGFTALPIEITSPGRL